MSVHQDMKKPRILFTFFLAAFAVTAAFLPVGRYFYFIAAAVAVQLLYLWQVFDLKDSDPVRRLKISLCVIVGAAAAVTLPAAFETWQDRRYNGYQVPYESLRTVGGLIPEKPEGKRLPLLRDNGATLRLSCSVNADTPCEKVYAYSGKYADVRYRPAESVLLRDVVYEIRVDGKAVYSYQEQSAHVAKPVQETRFALMLTLLLYLPATVWFAVHYRTAARLKTAVKSGNTALGMSLRQRL